MKKLMTHFSFIILVAFATGSQVFAGGPLSVDAGPDVDACPGDTIMLIANISNEVAPVTVSWSPTTNLTDPNNDTTYVIVDSMNDIEYVVTVSDAAPSSATDTILVDSRWIDIDGGPDVNLNCGSTTGLSVFPTGESQSADYLWSNGENGFFISNVTPGGYSVTATNSFSCTATDDINVFQNSIGQQVSFDVPSFICKDSSARLYNSSAEIDSIVGLPINSWTWDFGNGTSGTAFDSIDVTFDSAGTYTITLTMNLGPCNISHSEEIIVLDCAIGDDCSLDSTLTEPGLSPDQMDFPCVDRGVYFDEVIQFVNFDSIDFGGNSIVVQSIKINSIFNLPCGLTWDTDRPDGFYNGAERGCISIKGTTSDSVGQYPVELFVDAVVTGLIGPTPVELPNAPASAFGLEYTIRVKNAGTACWELDTGYVTYDSLLACNGGDDSLSIGLTDVSICPGDSVVLQPTTVGGNSPYTYQWSPATGLSCTYCESPTASPAVPTTYTVSVNDINGYVGSNSVTVGISEFEVDLGPDTVNLTCGIFAIDLAPSFTGDAAAPLSYDWSSGGADSIENVPAGSYDLVVTNTFGCTASDDIVVTVDSALSFDAGSETTYCDSATQTVQLMPNILTDGSGNYTYSWSPPIGLDDPTSFMPTATINDDVTYSLTIDDQNNGCSFTDSVHFEFFMLVVDAGDGFQFDGSGTQTLNPTVDTIRASEESQLRYVWSPTTGLSDFTIKNPTINSLSDDSVVFTLTVSNIGNADTCAFSDEVVILGPVGIEDIPLDAYVNVYPNPNNGNFRVVLNQYIGNEGTIEVFNVNGQTTYRQELANQEVYQLDLSDVAKGVYFISIETPNGRAIKRLTIQ